MYLIHYCFWAAEKFQVGKLLSASGKINLSCDWPSCMFADTSRLCHTAFVGVTWLPLLCPVLASGSRAGQITDELCPKEAS